MQHHYDDVRMGAIASQITSLAIVYSAFYSGVDQRKHQSSASLAFVWEFTGTGEFPAQRASYVENVSIWWRHHDNRGDITRHVPHSAVAWNYYQRCLTKIIDAQNILKGHQ